MNFGPQQQEALRKVDYWFKHETKRKPYFYLAGYAGSGKTTLAKHFREGIDGECFFMAYTGKAAHVMTQKGSPATTIHSAIYRLVKDPKTKRETWVLNRGSYIKNAKLIIVDEVSMVNEEIAEDLLSFKVPILVLGDPGQLPPVKGSGYFISGKPDMMLTEIHRQAKGNPIIELATKARKGERIELGTYGNSIVTDKLSMADASSVDQVLVGRNNTRESFNRLIRKAKGFEGTWPQKGEKLICLKNNSLKGILNGQTFIVDYLVPETQLTKKSRFLKAGVMSDEGRLIDVSIPKGYFDLAENLDEYVLKNGDQMDFAYAITCHKSQGSQWDSILVSDESWCFRESAKNWLYTSITRAAEKLILVRG